MRYLLLLLIATFYFNTSLTQTKTIRVHPPLEESNRPEMSGMSMARLARIDAMLEKAIADGEIPGAVALIAHKGEILYHKAFGMVDNPAKRAAKTDDIFRIASMSKAVTSTAVMMLWEEGLFRLDDPISKYIPEFKNPQVLKSYNYESGSYTTEAAKSEITIRQLLNHTSGIGYGEIDGDERFKLIYRKAGITDLYSSKDISIGESIKKLAKLPLHHHPGEAYVYSEGLDVLGYFIEVISGMTFADFLEEKLFKPLGMNDTYFYLPDSKADRLVKVQKKENGKWVHFPITFYDPDYPIKGAKKFYSGGAGLSSTALDYATFLQMYLNGGSLNGVRILSRTTVRSIMGNHVSHLKVWGNKNGHYGLAFGVVNKHGEESGGNGSEGTFSWGGYFNTQYFADPKEEVIGVLMKQTQGAQDNTGWKFRQMVFTAIDD